jgi:hypothetical protein
MFRGIACYSRFGSTRACGGVIGTKSDTIFFAAAVG